MHKNYLLFQLMFFALTAVTILQWMPNIAALSGA
jgi:hypothetical protein